jgi:hypothetical protein
MLTIIQPPTAFGNNAFMINEKKRMCLTHPKSNLATTNPGYHHEKLVIKDRFCLHLLVIALAWS